MTRAAGGAPAARRELARLDAIERRRDALLERLGSLDPARLGAHPRPGKWSMLEIVEHLVLAERRVLDRPPAADARRGPREGALYALVMFVLRWDVPVKVPSRAMIPTGEPSLEALGLAWKASHAELRRRLEGMDRDTLRASAFAHPVSGPMTAGQALRMLDVHLRRHIRQIRRLERLTAP